jgi:hypothetical protein
MVESGEKEKLGNMEFWMTCHCDGRNCQDLEVCEDKSTIFKPLGLIVYLVLRPNNVAVIGQLLRFYIVLETKILEGAEKSSQGCG